MFDAGEVIAIAIAITVAGCGIRDPQPCTCSTATTLAARLRALEHIKPTFLHVVGASRPRATTQQLSGLAFALWLRSLAALLLAFGGGHAVSELAGLHHL
jgi:hypothetical protein